MGKSLSNRLKHSGLTTLCSFAGMSPVQAPVARERTTDLLNIESLNIVKETPRLSLSSQDAFLDAHTAFQQTRLTTNTLAKNLLVRQATWASLNQFWPDLITDICPFGYRNRFLSEHQLENKRIQDNQNVAHSQLLNQEEFYSSLSKLNDSQLVALGASLAGNAVADFMADSLTHDKIRPATLKTFLNQVKTKKARTLKHTQNNVNQPQFAGFDPFGAMFAVGLTTYVYGKIKQQKTAINIGKTLMLVGIVPNLLLMGTAIAALIKVALFGAQ